MHFDSLKINIYSPCIALYCSFPHLSSFHTVGLRVQKNFFREKEVNTAVYNGAVASKRNLHKSVFNEWRTKDAAKQDTAIATTQKKNCIEKRTSRNNSDYYGITSYQFVIFSFFFSSLAQRDRDAERQREKDRNEIEYTEL